MADLSARWNGDNYQSRHFWLRAAALLDDYKKHVVEVTFEAQGPKAFDDVVVFYDPGRPSNGDQRVAADYFQIKWHTDFDGHFGYKDLIDPEFINAKSFSLLERLRQAKKDSPANSAFYLVTTHRISESDYLNKIVSGDDGSLRLKVLFDGTTDKSRMGRIRKLWRDHLGLTSDDELKDVLKGFHIDHGAPTLQKLREEVSLHFSVVGLDAKEASTAFEYDDFARKLVTKKLNKLNRADFRRLCEEEGWFRSVMPKARRSVSIRTYAPKAMPVDFLLAGPDETLVL